MDRKEFIKKVRKLRVPNFLFNLDGVDRDDERFCLVKVVENGMFIIQKEAVKLQMNVLTLKTMR